MKLPIVSRLTDALIAAGHQVQSVLDNGNGTFTVILATGSTQVQQTAANAFVTAYVDNPRKPRTIAAILIDFQALTSVQKNKLIEICIAKMLQQNPDFAAQVNVAISGDQPDP